MLFSIAPVPIYVPTNSVPFSTSSLTFVICGPLDSDHSDRCEVLFPFCFDLHFSDD